MDICHLKNAELEAKHPKYKGRVVLRGDIVKDESRSYAVFTEQGSSASQMTAAKIMDIISRLPGCDGQAADAVSAYTQVKMEDAQQQMQYQLKLKKKLEDAHKLFNISKSECPDIWIRLPRHKWPKSWSSLEDPVVFLERNLYGHPSAGLLWERQFEKILLKHGWEKIPNWECLFFHRQKGLFLSVYVVDIKLAGKKQSWSDVETTQQRSRFGRTNIFSWIMYTWAALNDNAKQAKILWTITEPCSNREFERVNRKTTIHSKYSYFFMVVWHGWSCKGSVWNDIVRKQTRRRNNSTKYLLHASMTTTSKKKKKWNLLEICHMYALKLF